MVIIKRFDASDAWYVYHRSLGYSDGLLLNGTSAKTAGFQSILSSSASAFLPAVGWTNINGASYIAYIFAHDTGSD